jgi:hypothetical protein
MTRRVVCPTNDTECASNGEEYEGFPIASVPGDGAVIVRLDKAMNHLARLWEEAVAGASDEYGSTVPCLYELTSAVIYPGGVEAVPALGTKITSIIQRPVDWAPGGPLRVAIVAYWTLEDGSWRLRALYSHFFQMELVLQHQAPENVLHPC